MTHAIYLIAAPTTQLKVGDLISKYFHRYKDYLELRAYLNNDSTTLYDTHELDTFMLESNHCFESRKQSHEELHYKDNKKKNKYPQGQILPTLTTFEYKIQKESISRSVTTTINFSYHKELEIDCPLLDTGVS